MSDVNTRSRMTYRARIERIDTPGTDAWGGGVPTWKTLHAALPCYPWSVMRRESVDADRTAVIEDVRMLVPKTADITERDRVNGITNRRAVPYLGGVWNVRSVQARPTHLEIALERAS